jgi:hypothetical protein
MTISINNVVSKSTIAGPIMSLQWNREHFSIAAEQYIAQENLLRNNYIYSSDPLPNCWPSFFLYWLMDHICLLFPFHSLCLRAETLWSAAQHTCAAYKRGNKVPLYTSILPNPFSSCWFPALNSSSIYHPCCIYEQQQSSTGRLALMDFFALTAQSLQQVIRVTVPGTAACIQPVMFTRPIYAVLMWQEP